MSGLPLTAIGLVLELEDTSGKKYQLHFNTAGSIHLTGLSEGPMTEAAVDQKELPEVVDLLNTSAASNAAPAPEVVNLLDILAESTGGSTKPNIKSLLFVKVHHSATAVKKELPDEDVSYIDNEEESNKDDELNITLESEEFVPEFLGCKKKAFVPKAYHQEEAHSRFTTAALCVTRSSNTCGTRSTQSRAVVADDDFDKYEEVAASQEFWGNL
jgi:hypothetical protein